MASVAPFGTDVQPPLLVKIVGGKLTYVSNGASNISEAHATVQKVKEAIINEDLTTVPTHSEDQEKDSSQDSHAPSMVLLSDSELMDLLAHCHAHSTTTGLINKHRLFKMLKAESLKMSDESIERLVAISNCTIDSHRIDYVKFITNLRDSTSRTDKLRLTDSKKHTDFPNGISSSASWRLSRTCPPCFFARKNSTDAPLCLLRPHTDSSSNITSCGSRTQEGLPHLYAALRKCSSISNKINKSHAVRVIQLYNSIYRMNLPVLQIEAFIATKTDSQCLMTLLETNELIEYIRSVVPPTS